MGGSDVKIFGNERMILGIYIHDIARVLDVSERIDSRFIVYF